MKYCNYCSKSQNDHMFRKNRRKCKACEREDGRNYGKKHFNTRKKWRQKNSKLMTSLQAKWYQKNKRKIREKNNLRYHTDLEVKKRKNITRVIQSSFKRKGRCKYWNCSYDFLVDWLKFNFDSNMSIESNGTFWHQDHVIPKSRFKLLDENGNLNMKNVRLCFSWFNITPITGKANMQKHDCVDSEQMKQHLNRLRDFGSDVDSDYYELCEQYLTNTT